jgi:ornithine--oxo-acid transaminase
MEAWIEIAERYLAQTYLPLPVVLKKGRGVWVWDLEGKKYLDLLSCYSAVSAGHCHPRLVKVLKKQAQTLDAVSRAFYHQQFSLFLKELSEFAGFEKVLPMNTGVEAVERAIKTARKWGYQVKKIPKYQAQIIVCENNFHGRTITAISASSEALYKENFGPFTPGFKIIPFGDLQSLNEAIDQNTVAFLVEPIQAEAGIIIPPDGYLKKAKEICQEKGILFILDEIQTGLGRCGKKFAFQLEEAQPDLLILGKFLGGGLYPVSSVLGKKEILDLYLPGEDGSTFSGNPLACAVAREVLKIIDEEKLAERAKKQGQYFLEELRKIKSPWIKEIRGKGFLIGIELWSWAGGARKFAEKLMAEGILCKETHGQVIRIAPPLIIRKKEIDFALEKLKKVLEGK